MIACLAVTSMVFASCDKQDDPIDDPNVVVESISLDKTTLTIAIGESVNLLATTVPANATVTWTNSNDNAIVANGKVTGKAEGTVVITAKAGEKTAECTVTVRGALINGVVWALRNVDAVGTFAAAPESTGKFYQWNRKVAWAGTFNENQLISGWDATTPTGTEWAKANDPSPLGWRVPKLAEIEKLLDVAKVGRTWTAQNGINGYRFTDNTNSASIFLPAVGNIDDGYHTHYGTDGYYWSATQVNEQSGKFLAFFEQFPQADNQYRNSGLSVRSVLE